VIFNVSLVITACPLVATLSLFFLQKHIDDREGVTKLRSRLPFKRTVPQIIAGKLLRYSQQLFILGTKDGHLETQNESGEKKCNERWVLFYITFRVMSIVLYHLSAQLTIYLNKRTFSRSMSILPPGAKKNGKIVSDCFALLATILPLIWPLFCLSLENRHYLTYMWIYLFTLPKFWKFLPDKCPIFQRWGCDRIRASPRRTLMTWTAFSDLAN